MELGQELPDVTSAIPIAELKRKFKGGHASIGPDTGKPSIGKRVATTARVFLENTGLKRHRRPGRS